MRFRFNRIRPARRRARSRRIVPDSRRGDSIGWGTHSANRTIPGRPRDLRKPGQVHRDASGRYHPQPCHRCRCKGAGLSLGRCRSVDAPYRYHGHHGAPAAGTTFRSRRACSSGAPPRRTEAGSPTSPISRPIRARLYCSSGHRRGSGSAARSSIVGYASGDGSG